MKNENTAITVAELTKSSDILSLVFDKNFSKAGVEFILKYFEFTFSYAVSDKTNKKIDQFFYDETISQRIREIVEFILDACHFQYIHEFCKEELDELDDSTKLTLHKLENNNFIEIEG